MARRAVFGLTKMTEVMTQPNAYRADFDRLIESSADAPAWLADLRRNAMERFEQLGFPTTKHEDWRFTNIKPIANTAFALCDGTASVPADEVDQYALGGISAARLVFVNGRYAAGLSLVRSLPTGVTLTSLAEAIATRDAELEPHLGRHADFTDDAFAALNTAFITDGAYLHVEAGVTVDGPIHLLFISTENANETTPHVSHPRNLVVVDKGANVTVVESHVSHGDIASLSNGVTEFVVADGADAKHYLIERESESAFNVETLAFEQGAASRFESHSALFGGSIVRNNVRAKLIGEGAHSVINGLYMPRGKQHMDNHMRVVHAAPNCDSRQFYKGILDGESRGVFAGRIVVDQIAQKTDAKQSNRNLLLSDKAGTHAMPQLEIYADDVKCTHGATTGEIDPKHLFYLQARGIPVDVARSMLIYAFAHEVLDRMTVEPLREQLEVLLMQRLPHAEKLATLLG
ncbi:MAG: Fe-S cluster assembly protein SufD [Phycisphaera sp.]|nr:Fe-S cluster assembly protein SufD [Phycisphaera sp.]